MFLSVHFSKFSISRTAFATIFHQVPIFLPFLSPRKWSSANKTNLLGELRLLQVFGFSRLFLIMKLRWEKVSRSNPKAPLFYQLVFWLGPLAASLIDGF